MRWWKGAILALAGVVALAAVEACSNCASACSEVVSPILHVNGYTIVSATSSCNNLKSPLPGKELSASALGPAGGSCTFDVTLDDGETLSFDVPFTTDAQLCCCDSCSTVKSADFAALTISAPSGYLADSGAD